MENSLVDINKLMAILDAQDKENAEMMAELRAELANAPKIKMCPSGQHLADNLWCECRAKDPNCNCENPGHMSDGNCQCECHLCECGCGEWGNYCESHA